MNTQSQKGLSIVLLTSILLQSCGGLNAGLASHKLNAQANEAHPTFAEQPQYATAPVTPEPQSPDALPGSSISNATSRPNGSTHDGGSFLDGKSQARRSTTSPQTSLHTRSRAGRLATTHRPQQGRANRSVNAESDSQLATWRAQLQAKIATLGEKDPRKASLLSHKLLNYRGTDEQQQALEELQLSPPPYASTPRLLGGAKTTEQRIKRERECIIEAETIEIEAETIEQRIKEERECIAELEKELAEAKSELRQVESEESELSDYHEATGAAEGAATGATLGGLGTGLLTSLGTATYYTGPSILKKAAEGFCTGGPSGAVVSAITEGVRISGEAAFQNGVMGFGGGAIGGTIVGSFSGYHHARRDRQDKMERQKREREAAKRTVKFTEDRLKSARDRLESLQERLRLRSIPAAVPVEQTCVLL